MNYATYYYVECYKYQKIIYGKEDNITMSNCFELAKMLFINRSY